MPQTRDPTSPAGHTRGARQQSGKVRETPEERVIRKAAEKELKTRKRVLQAKRHEQAGGENKKRKTQQSGGTGDGNSAKKSKQQANANQQKRVAAPKKPIGYSEEDNKVDNSDDHGKDDNDDDDHDNDDNDDDNDDDDDDDDGNMWLNKLDEHTASSSDFSESCSDSEDSFRIRVQKKRREHKEKQARLKSRNKNASQAVDGTVGNNAHQQMRTHQGATTVVRDERRQEEPGKPWSTPTEMKNVRQRIVFYVKNNMFRRIKFLTSTAAFESAFQGVLNEEKPKDPYIFQLTYKKCFEKALNQKRSTCEQAARKIVMRAISTFKSSGEDFFTFDELCSLRRAKTDREKRAFLWFFDTFVECVCGSNAWNYAKTRQCVSEAKDASGMRIVSKSDEAFALLLIDNYMEKWSSRADPERRGASSSGAEANGADDADNNRITGAGDGAAEKRRKRTAGKYTAKASGQCRYGGWSDEGILQFNRLRAMIKADRKADRDLKDTPYKREKELLSFCRFKAGIRNAIDDDQPGAHNNTGARNAARVEHVEAEWDSDDN